MVYGVVVSLERRKTNVEFDYNFFSCIFIVQNLRHLYFSSKVNTDKCNMMMITIVMTRTKEYIR